MLRLTEENRRWWTLAAMCFALFMAMLDNSVVNVALPEIEEDLDASLAALQWTISAYTLTFSVALVTGGRLGDIFGRRRAFLTGVAIFALSSAGIGIAPSQTALVVGRALQGVGAALMMPATLSIITNAFPAHERGKAIGTWSGVSGVALAIGPVIGGALTEYVSWRAIFFLNLPVAAGAVIVALFSTRESRDETVEKSVDQPGIAALTLGLTSLVLALVQANAWGWSSPGIVALLAAAAIGLAAFVIVERRVPAPIVDFAFFRSRTFLGATLAAFIQALAMMVVFFFMTLYMQNVLGYDPVATGIRFLPYTVMIMLVSPLAGRVVDRVGPRPLIVTGLLVIGSSLFAQSRIDVDSGYGLLLPAFLVMGLGLGMTLTPMSTAAMNSINPDKAGVGSGILSMSRMVGGTLGIAALGALFSHLAAGRVEKRLADAPLEQGQLEHIADNVAAGAEGALPDGLDPSLAATASSAVEDAFIHALSSGLLVSMSLTVAGAVAALVLIEPRYVTPEPTEERRTSSAAIEAIARS